MDWSGRSGDQLTSSMLIREGNPVNTLMALLSSSSPQPCFRGFDGRLNGTVFKRPLLPSLDVGGLGENDLIDYTDQSYHTEKKRRLTVEQVRCLEKSFKLENKLEPEKKMELAQELGLQPRQVAVWFQNRRARWKSKQLEQDYDVLKTEYDALLNEKRKLEAEVVSLTDKLVSKESTSKSVEDDGLSSPSESQARRHVNSDIATSVDSENQVDVSSDFQVSCQSFKKTCNYTIKPNIEEYSPKSDGYNSDVLDLGSPCNPIHITPNHEQDSEDQIISSNQHKTADHTRETFAYFPVIEAPYGTVFNNNYQIHEEIAYKLEDGLFYDQEFDHNCNMPDNQSVFPSTCWFNYWP